MAIKLFLKISVLCMACITLTSGMLPKRLDVAYSSQAKSDGCHINSIEHFEAAIAAGFNCLKADMQITQDGIIVLCHDKGFTIDGDGRIGEFDKQNYLLINDLSYDEIKGLEYATGKSATGQHPKVATLDELLGLARKSGVWVYITVRNNRQEDVLTEARRALKRNRMMGRCIINNYTPDDETCRIIRKVLPKAPISYTTTPKMFFSKELVDRVVEFAPVMLCMNKAAVEKITPEDVKYAESKGVRILGWYPAGTDQYRQWQSVGLTGAQIRNYLELVP